MCIILFFFEHILGKHMCVIIRAIYINNGIKISVFLMNNMCHLFLHYHLRVESVVIDTDFTLFFTLE
jgi:hypothetical protein